MLYASEGTTDCKRQNINKDSSDFRMNLGSSWTSLRSNVQFLMPISPSNLQKTPKDKKANMVIHGLVDKVLHFAILVEKLPVLDFYSPTLPVG